MKISEDKISNEKLTVFGNLPYNISTEVIIKCIENRIYMHSAFFMMQKEFVEGVPSKKLGTAEDIYHAINFLVSSDYTNGSVITIDGCME